MHDDPATLTSDQRRAELAAIFANGIVRLHRRPHVNPNSLTQIPLESSENRLDVPLETSVHGARPVNAGENYREEHA
jgi:hypothetical protein